MHSDHLSPCGPPCGRTDLWRGIIAPHLLPHLLQGAERGSRFGPLGIIALGWLLAVLAIAGPTWRHEPSPFAEDPAALAIVVKVTPSMMTGDVQPTRLSRATEKIHDLLARRGAAKTALIAYSGTAHLVMPATKDVGIIETFAQALDPRIMPSEGDAAAKALQLADQALSHAGAGSILWVSDSIAAEERQSLAAWRSASPTPVRLLPPLLPGPELDAVRALAPVDKARLVRLTADDSDVRILAREATFSTAARGGSGARWEECGYWLTPVLALLFLPFFSRGWMIAAAAKQ